MYLIQHSKALFEKNFFIIHKTNTNKDISHYSNSTTAFFVHETIYYIIFLSYMTHMINRLIIFNHQQTK